MKTLLILISIITYNSCSGAKNVVSTQNTEFKDSYIEKNTTQEKDTTYQYRASTRGYSLLITVSKDSYSISSDRNIEQPANLAYDKEKWNNLTLALEKVELDKLPNLEPPSTTFRYDAAAMATLTVIINGEKQQTKTFDHGNPPKEINEIVKILLSFSEKE